MSDKPVYDPSTGKYRDKDGNLVVWDGSVGKYIPENDSLENSKKFLSRVGFNFSDEPADEPAKEKSTMSNICTCVVKIVNDRTGKFEVEQSSNPALLSVGSVGTSLYLTGKDLNSTWLCEIRVTGKGSLKVDNVISRHDKSISTITGISDPREIISSESEPEMESTEVEPESIKIQPEPEIISSIEPDQPEEKIISIPMALNTDVMKWNEPDYYISPDARLVFATAYQMLKSDSGKSVKILMTGESGYGKTTVAEKFAAHVGFNCLRVNCATVRDTEEWFLDREVIEQNGASVTKFIRSEFANKIARGNIVIILDEFNRLEPNLHNSLFPLLDDSGKTTLHHLDFTVGPNVIFVATVNLGYKFVGTFALDDALMNRFEFVLEVSAMPFDQEVAVLETRHSVDSEIAEKIVKLATTLRDNEISCSTRDTLRVAKMVQNGLSLRDSFEYAIIRRIPNDETGAPLRKSLVDLVNGQLGARDFTFSALT